MSGRSEATSAIGGWPVVMSRRLIRVAWTVEACAVVLGVVTIMLVALAGPQDPVQPPGWPRIAMPICFLELSTVGFLIAARHPRNPIGWILCLSALSGLIGEFAKQYANVGLSRGPGSIPGIEAMAWLACVSTISTAWPVLTLGFLLFPNGHLPSRRWRPLASLSAGVIALVTAMIAFLPGQLALEFPSVRNPYGVGSAYPPLLMAIGGLAGYVLWACVLGSIASMYVRLRRARGEQRQQIKWVTYAATLVGIEAIVSIALHPVPDYQPGSVEGPIVVTILAIAFGVAILKYRLYDIDVVISKTVIYGTLAVFITTVYVALVVGVGTAVGVQGTRSLALSILGAAVVAAVFQPVRERVERLARRLVFGKRSTPYEVLARFSERMAAIHPTEDVLPGMARLLAEGTGSARAEVWLRFGEQQHMVARWPREESGPERQRAPDTELPDSRADTCTVLVRHHGEVLGALAVRMRPGFQLSPPEEKLLADLAGQAGLVLRNARLVEDLRRSRERLITARDAEQRRLERDIRERVARPLSAVAAVLDCPPPLVGTDEERQIITELRAETASALIELHDLARGVYPPLLASDGLAAALRAHVGALPLPVTIEADGVGRLQHDVEAAVYFCCLEAMQNVSKHAKARRVRVSLSKRPSRLEFRVDDDGVGFQPAPTTRGSGLQNMADRAEALGGTVLVSSAVGRGTTVTGWLPALTVESMP